MKNKVSKFLLPVSGLIATASVTLTALAQSAPIQPGPQAIPPPQTNVSFTTFSGILCTAVSWIFTLLIILTVIYVLFAAYNYLTSGGEEEKIKKANHMLMYAAIALIVAILSRGIPIFVNALLGGGALPSC